MGLPTSKVFIPGFRLIADDAGSYIDDVSNIRLGPEFVLTRNTADPSASISVANYIATQVAAALADQPVKIDEQNLSGVATYVSPTFTADAYRKLTLEIVGSASGFSYVQFQVNADATSVYTDIGTNVNSVATVDSAFKGTNGFARVGIFVGAGKTSVHRIEFWPMVTGGTRPGLASSLSDGNSGTAGNSYFRVGGFAYNDTDTPVTSVKVSLSSGTITGNVKLYGIRA